MQKNLKADSKMTNKNPYALILIKAYGFICYVNFTGVVAARYLCLMYKIGARSAKIKPAFKQKPKRRRECLLFYVNACAT